MAKVTGPLLSVSASGTVGGILHYQPTRKGANVKMPWVQPPGTAQAQIQQQCGYAVAAQVYRVQKATVDATWAEEAEKKRITPFSAYLSAFLTNWQAGVIVMANGIIRENAILDGSMAWARSAIDGKIYWTQPNIQPGFVVARWIKIRIGAFPDQSTGNSIKCTGILRQYIQPAYTSGVNYRARSCVITSSHQWYTTGSTQITPA
jgi:hypothetical protein